MLLLLLLLRRRRRVLRRLVLLLRLRAHVPGRLAACDGATTTMYTLNSTRSTLNPDPYRSLSSPAGT